MTMIDNYALVRQAILNKDLVVATYQNHRREMCPHIIGTKGGKRAGLFYQFGGSSKSGLGPDGSPENWRCIPIDQLQDLETKKGPWHTASDYSPQQTCVDQIDVEVTY